MIDREFFLGFIKVHILYHAGKEPVSGVDLAEELTRHGYHLSPGTLYPTLHRLEKEGYLQLAPEIVAGRVRKYYTLTSKGRKALSQAKKKIGELVSEVIDER